MMDVKRFLSIFMLNLILVVLLQSRVLALESCESLFSEQDAFKVTDRYDPHLFTEKGKIKLSVYNTTASDSRIRKAFLNFLDLLFGLPASIVMGVEKLSQVAENYSRLSDSIPYWRRLSQSFRLKLTFNVQSFPSTGPLIVVLPHVAGGVDLIAVASMLTQKRSDPLKIKLLLSRRFRGIDGVVENSFLIDTRNNAESKLYNSQVEKEVTEFLTSGGCIVMALQVETPSSQRKTAPMLGIHFGGLVFIRFRNTF